MSNKVPCGGFTLGDGLYMDGTTLRGGVFYTVKKSEMTLLFQTGDWSWKIHPTEDEWDKIHKRFEEMAKSPMYIMYVDDTLSSPRYIPYLFKHTNTNYLGWANSTLNQPLVCLGELGDGRIFFSHTKAPFITVTLDLDGIKDLTVTFAKQGNNWGTSLEYNELNTISLSTLNRQRYRILVDEKWLQLSIAYPFISYTTRGTPTYYFYSNPITADDSSSYYYRVTFSPDNSVTVDKITFANTSVESV